MTIQRAAIHTITTPQMMLMLHRSLSKTLALLLRLPRKVATSAPAAGRHQWRRRAQLLWDR
jgi:hypothetical protein